MTLATLKDNLEPEAFGVLAPGEFISDGTNTLKVAAVSIAISLKRIADMMSEVNEYGEGPAAAIGGNIARAFRDRR